MNYELIKPDIEQIYRQGEGKGILSWSPLEAYALTSGTTGGSKYFPITKRSLNVFKRGTLSLYAAACNAQKNLTDLLAKGKILYLSATPCRHLSPTKLIVGFMSGYMHLKRHWLYKDLLYPTISTALIKDVQIKMQRIFEEIRQEDIYIIMGFPAVIRLFTMHALSYYGINYLRQLWPNLQLCLYGGNYLSESNRQYLEENWIGPGENQLKITFIENYSAVEGFFGHTLYQEWPGLVFNSLDIFFQFKEHPEDTIFLQLHELKLAKKYYVYITSVNGLINYAMDDIIEITSVYPLTFKFVARDKEQISLVAEKILLADVQYAVDMLVRYSSYQIHDFAVYLKNDTSAQLVFIFAKNLTEINNNQDEITILDNALRERNPCYSDYRASKIYTLPEIKYQTPEFFNAYRERNIHKGNFKEKRLFMSETAFTNEYY